MGNLKFNKSYGLASLLVLSVAVIAVWLWGFFTPSPKDIRHVILISIDTCRADYLSCYGYPNKTTPNIDAFAKESILFENVISPVPITLPAHSSMLTGTIPPYHGAHNNMEFYLGKSNLTLAEILRPKGFTTAGIISSVVLDSGFGMDQGFDYYNDTFEEAHYNVFGSERRAEETSHLAIEWLDKHKNEKFFLFLHYYDPHYEYVPPEPFASEFADNLYAGEIAYTDYCIGRVIEKLKELGLYNSTLIIITGDHGEMLGEHGEEEHTYFIYQSAIKVPLIFKLPGRTKPKNIDRLVGLADIVPTICGLLGIETPPQVQGKDLSLYFGGKRTLPQDRYLYCESLIPVKYNAAALLGVVTNRWKYIQTTRPELYDIVEDPDEINDLINQQPKQARILQDALEQILEQTIRKDASKSKIDLDEQTLKRLKSLGYVRGSGHIDKVFKFDQNKEDPKDLLDFHLSRTKVNVLISKKKYAQAKTICEKLLRERPQLYQVHLDMAQIAAGQNDFNKAVTHYRSGLKLNPNDPISHNRLGSILCKQGKIDEGAEHFKKALKINPEMAEAYRNLAMAYYYQGKNQQAIEYCTYALERNPQSLKAHYYQGLALYKLGQTDQAINCFKKALEINPELAEVHNALAGAFLKQNKLDDAISHYQKSLQLSPDQPDMLENIARIYFRQGQTEQAFNHWNRALQIKPDLAEVLNDLAWVKASYKNVSFHNPKEAIKLAQRASEITDYKEPRILNTLSIAYAAAGRFPEAVETAEKALSLAKSSNRQKLAEKIQNNLELYKHNQAYYDDSAQSQEKSDINERF